MWTKPLKLGHRSQPTSTYAISYEALLTHFSAKKKGCGKNMEKRDLGQMVNLVASSFQQDGEVSVRHFPPGSRNAPVIKTRTSHNLGFFVTSVKNRP